MNYFKKLFEGFFYLAILMVIEVVIVYFLKDSEHFDKFMGISCILDLTIFFGILISAGSYSKGIRKYKKKLGVNSYTPLFYCFPPDDGRIFPAAGLFTKNSLIICSSTNNISHDVIDDFWEEIESDLLHIPFSSIKEVGINRIKNEHYQHDQHAANVNDWLWNQTAGRVLRNKRKTIVFTAVIYIVFFDAEGQEHISVFGIGENTKASGLSVLIDPVLPEWMNTAIEVTETIVELTEEPENATSKELRLARKIATHIVKKVNAGRV